MKKLLAVLLCLCMVLCACAAPAPEAEADPAPAPVEPAPAPEAEPVAFTPGVYTGTGFGHNGKIVVEAEFDETSLKSVTIVENYESKAVQPYLNVVPEAVVANQSLAVDTVAGATFCGRGALAAITDCVEQAGVDPADFSAPVADAPAPEAEYTADVIVIGAGGSGLTAGTSAHQNGASVIIIEKLGMAGGSTAFSGGAYNAADQERSKLTEMTDSNRAALEKLLNKEPHDDYEAQLQAAVKEQYAKHVEAGYTYIFDCKELHMLQTYNGGDYYGNPELITVLCENALPTLEWVESLGATYQDKLGMATGAIWQRSHYGTKDYYGDGMAYVTPHVNYFAETDNSDIHYNTAAYELIQKDGAIVGVKAKCGDTDVTYYANKGVVMATGGFGANIEMREYYNEQWDDLGPNVGCSNQNASAQGDGIKMGIAVNAQLVDMGLIQLHPNGFFGTGNMMIEPKTSGLNRIFVNSDGNRFVAEDARRDVMVNAISAQEGGYMWVIADAAKYAEGTVSIENSVEVGLTYKANSVEELAELIGVPADNLQASIDQYNAIVDGAEDPFGLTTYDQKLGNPPYWAGKRSGTVHHTMGGLKIDTQARVIDNDGNVIPGFYAAGEVTGDIHGGNRLGGNAIADINVFGRIAGASAATLR